MISGILEKIGWQALLPAQKLVDFELAASLAFEIAGEEGLMSDKEKEKLSREYFQVVADVTPLVTEYIKAGKAPALSPVLAFNRKEWIVVNLENLKFFLEQLSKSYWESLQMYSKAIYPLGGRVLRKISNLSVTSELGVLMGYFSRRVLAQYDWQVPSPAITGRLLYFVEPNIKAWEERLHLRPYRVREWICLHEVAHSLQFGLHPWLEGYILSLLQEYIGLAEKALGLIEEKLSKERMPLSWSWLWWKQLVGPEYQTLVGRVQAAMSLLEGYSDHIMMEVGKKHLPYDEYLIAVLRRRVGQSLASYVLERLLGFHLKLKQYELGEHFVSTVVRQRGLEFLNQVWQAPEKLPSWEEIHYPEKWIDRMGRR